MKFKPSIGSPLPAAVVTLALPQQSNLCYNTRHSVLLLNRHTGSRDRLLVRLLGPRSNWPCKVVVLVRVNAVVQLVAIALSLHVPVQHVLRRRQEEFLLLLWWLWLWWLWWLLCLIE